MPFFQCSSVDLVPSTTSIVNWELDDFLVVTLFFSVAVHSGLCLLVGNLSPMRFSYVCLHSMLISAPHWLAETWKLSGWTVTGGVGGRFQIPETWVLVLPPFLLCCQNAPQSLLTGYYHSYPLGWSNVKQNNSEILSTYIFILSSCMICFKNIQHWEFWKIRY